MAKYENFKGCVWICLVSKQPLSLCKPPNIMFASQPFDITVALVFSLNPWSTHFWNSSDRSAGKPKNDTKISYIDDLKNSLRNKLRCLFTS